MEFVIDENKYPFTIKGRDGKVESFELWEMTAKDRGIYMDNFYKKVDLDADGKAKKVTSYDGIYTDLVGLCVRYTDGKKVPKEVVDEWPHSIVEKLYDKAKELNGFDKGPEQASEDAKKG